MAITELEAIPVEMEVKPLDEEGGIAPYISSHNKTYSRQRVLIRLETDDGIVGWGETRPTLSSTSTKTILENDVAPEAVGHEIWQIESFLDNFHYEYLNIQSVIAGAEMAMWDALGKDLGVPVHQLIGGKCTDSVPFAFCLGILKPDESREHARYALNEGFDVLKTKAGLDWQQDVDRIKAMHNEVNGEFEFRLDPNQEWSLDEAVRVGANLEDAGIYLQYMEQPIRVDSYGSLKRLRERLRTPIAVNEDTYHPHNMHLAGREDAIDAAVVDLVPAGGILGLKRIAALASEQGLSVSHHNAFDLGIKTAAVLHSVSSTPSINLPPDTIYYAWRDDVISEPFEVRNGTIAVPDEPGLGIEVDESKLEQYRIDEVA
jgi:L-alanine-DL-glutamate epimerase-like enolase superfamily enzyme